MAFNIRKIIITSLSKISPRALASISTMTSHTQVVLITIKKLILTLQIRKEIDLLPWLSLKFNNTLIFMKFQVMGSANDPRLRRIKRS